MMMMEKLTESASVSECVCLEASVTRNDDFEASAALAVDLPAFLHAEGS